MSTLFASFLGYNPMSTLLGPHVLNSLPPGQAATITGRSFFPQLISAPFHTALHLRVHVRDHRLPRRRGRLAAARRQVRARDRGEDGSDEHVVPVVVVDPISDETSIMSDALEAEA